MAETTRPILERIMDSVKWNITPDSDTTQALKNAFPILANDLDNMDKLTPEYIKWVLIPAIKKMNQADLIKLNQSLGTKSELKSLVQDIHDVTVYIPKDGNAFPWVQNSAESIKSPIKSWYKSMVDFMKSLAWIEDVKEQEETLMAEIIASANRSVAKFDQYVLRGDGKQYGDKANDLFEIDSWNTDIRRPTNDKKIRHNVENVPKIDFVWVVNDVVAMAKDPASTVNINNAAQPVWGGTRVEKLAYLVSWMSALEEWCDRVLPWLVAEAANKTAKVAIDSTFGVAGDVAWGIWDEYPKTIVITASLLGYAAYKTGWLLKGMVNIPGAWVKLVGKAAAFIPIVNKLAPFIDKMWTWLSVFWDKLVTPAWAPWTPGISEVSTPRRFVAVNPADLKDFKPWEANHAEYYKKTLEAIKTLWVAPTTLVAGGPPVLVPEEVALRTAKFMNLDAEYRGGKMSLAEYLKRTEDIMKWFWKVFVKDTTGKIDWDKTWKNTLQRLGDRTPLVSPFTRNNTNGSLTSSVGGIREAQKRIKGTSYESVDFAGVKVEFADTTAKVLFEEFRDKLEKYTQMQDWDAINREIIAKEWLKNQIQSTDVPAKNAEITAKSAIIGGTPATIPGPPMVVNGVAVPTQVANPLLVTLNEDLRGIQQDLRDMNNQVRTINAEIATLRWKKLSYVPSGGTRIQFQTDIRALKLEISNPAGTPWLIQKINTYAGSTVIADTAFNPKDLKLNKLTLIEIAKTALKK